MEKLRIKNRNGLTVVLELHQTKQQQGLAFVMHGLGGFKEQPHVQTFVQAFLDRGFTVVNFDTTNTLGESDGDYADATVTNYYQDLEDVIVWAGEQPWYQEPFVLTGHSLGGICTALYAEKYPNKVLGLAPVSTVVSGKLSLEAPHIGSQTWQEWKRTGWRESTSRSKPGVAKRLKWSHVEDRLQYDLLANVQALAMPVLMIVGSQDDSTPPEHQRILFDKLPGRKEFHIIEGAPHTFRDPAHLAIIKSYFDNWIKQL